MAKVALLIGVSEYGEGLPSLPGTQGDLQIMQRVLQDPKVGGFDTVEVLSNPDRTQMEMAIETLFSENRSRDDLILLYFSGHGFRDDNGSLYFCARNSQQTKQRSVSRATTVRARDLHDYMSQSRCKRQVLILDCCFSGAFAKDMQARKAEVVAIDLKAELGSEGRAVLTSSTATQVSYERDGTGIYTRYLVQGLETGAADRDEDGKITVDELHEYAREKVQEAAPSMQPEIYAVRQGYKIFIARAPQGDQKLVFRKEVNERAKQKQGKFSPIDQRSFKILAQRYGLSDHEAEQILEEVLQPYQLFWAKLDDFEQAIKDVLLYDPQVSDESINDLKYFQQVLQLRDEDIGQILGKYLQELAGGSQQLITMQDTSQENVSSQVRQVSALEENLEHSVGSSDKSQSYQSEVELVSECNIDYTKLRDLLRNGKWKEADLETYEVMIQAVGKKSEGHFTSEELSNFPCVDLKTIDRLWVKYSNGKWGFSVQKHIWEECGSPMDYNADWERFGDRVGWRKDGDWMNYSDLTFYPGISLYGEFPVARRGRWWGLRRFLVLGVLFSRVKTCGL